MWPKALETMREFWRHRNGDKSLSSLSLIVVDLHTSRHIIGGCCDGSTMETRLAVKPRLFAYFSHAEYLVLVVYTEVETVVGVGVRKHRHLAPARSSIAPGRRQVVQMSRTIMDARRAAGVGKAAAAEEMSIRVLQL